jgi:autotransporter-associated beta strand protein
VANSGLVDLAGGNRNFNVADGAAAIDVAINTSITNGALTKSGSGTLALGGTNDYTGGTSVLGGTLSLASATTLADTSNLFVSTGAKINLGFGGSDAIDKLFFNGAEQASGTWGATGSGADHIDDLFFSGGGMLSVGVPPIVAPDNVLDNFDVDEGHFGWNYNASPASQTAGLSAATTVERVTTDAQAGPGSQLLNLVSNGDPSWKIRHNSGLQGPGNQATPQGNVPLDSTGYIGFWLKTDDPGIEVQILVDDPGTAEMGTLQEVIADGQWHLYQWNLEDDSQWDGWVNGNGSVDQASVTIDSIYFWGAGDAQIYLDTVSHNPEGMLTVPTYAPGDFNKDGFVDGDDLSDWKNNVGMTETAEVEDGDADADGDVDGADFLAWQRNVTVGPGAAPVPEPAAGVLAALAATGLLLARRRR